MVRFFSALWNRLFGYLPWTFVIRSLARRHGFIDPLSILSRLYTFSQPALVRQPIELLRAGMVFHARGLLNTQAIQHNLDWIWPYWVERQFDPLDKSFIPRAFSITHVNLTHRNWTAVGLPNNEALPIVDPRGLVMPEWDSWSLDFWLVDGRRKNITAPSRSSEVFQELMFEEGELVVRTQLNEGKNSLEQRCFMSPVDSTCTVDLNVISSNGGSLVVALRPFNPEGISLIEHIALTKAEDGWCINGNRLVQFSKIPRWHLMSNYREGDVAAKLVANIGNYQTTEEVRCSAGMATAAAVFPLGNNEPYTLRVNVPLQRTPLSNYTAKSGSTSKGGDLAGDWSTALNDTAALEIPDLNYSYLYQAAIRTLILHSPGEVFPGPYTYKRFWIRDAAFILHALLTVNLKERALNCLPAFRRRQVANGYFLSQEGEWDSNGEVLWLLGRIVECIKGSIGEEWMLAVQRGANWIVKKRVFDRKNAQHYGLLPPGFSAEHLGPADYYYWDNYWAVAGLQSAAALMKTWGLSDDAELFLEQAADLRRTINRSIQLCSDRIGVDAIPASPYRRLDAGAIGSIVCSYPLRLVEPRDRYLLGTLEFLHQHCLLENAFFQDMVHSGLNPYLTLHMAQCFLRAQDWRYLPLMDRVARLASPTGQWPEAIHPATQGGCMGDGQHAWAAAEWVLMVRSLFVQEGLNGLIFLAGIPEHWLAPGSKVSFGPTLTAYGRVSIVAEASELSITVSWRATWHEKQPLCIVRVQGLAEKVVTGEDSSITVFRTDKRA